MGAEGGHKMPGSGLDVPAHQISPCGLPKSRTDARGYSVPALRPSSQFEFQRLGALLIPQAGDLDLQCHCRASSGAPGQM